tara:strand:- start:4794 stop:5087 length:294 start_codon:yes stop_codon:yes gene_type:complete
MADRQYVGGNEQDMDDAARIIYSDQFLREMVKFINVNLIHLKDWRLQNQHQEAYLDQGLDSLVRTKVVEFNNQIEIIIAILESSGNDYIEVSNVLKE